jgi:hypothetical protein
MANGEEKSAERAGPVLRYSPFGISRGSQMRRRDFITLVGSTAAWPLAAHAQQIDRMRRIGVLSAFSESDPEAQANLTAFRQTLQKLGWTDGRNVRLDYRWGEAEPVRIRAQAKELVGLNPDAILVSSALALQPLLEEDPQHTDCLHTSCRSGRRRPRRQPGGTRRATSQASPSPSFRRSGNCWKS